MSETTLTQRLHPLVQLVPAAVVAAAVLVTLPHTGPVLAEVPERLSAPSEETAEPTASEEPEAESEALPALPYADGVYTGSSRGYGGPVKVQVTMEGGYITDIQILDASHETSAFLKRAKRLVPTVMDAQTWEVDAVSEATYTSRGILGAIQNALTGEEVINPAPPKTEEPKPLVVEEFTPPSAYLDGVYTASADGFGGPITVQVTISGDSIADISIVSADGETRSYFSRARRVVSTILETGTPDVDTVSGATYSSTGIINAVKLALSKAANPDTQAEAPTEAPVEESAPAETPAQPQYSDGTYTGSYASPEGPVTVSVTVSGGQVTSVVVLPTEVEDPSFWARAKAKLKAFFSDEAEEPKSTSTLIYSLDTLPENLKTAVDTALQAALTEPETPAESAPEAAPAETEPTAESPAETEAAPAEEPAAEPTAESAPEEETPASEPEQEGGDAA